MKKLLIILFIISVFQSFSQAVLIKTIATYNPTGIDSLFQYPVSGISLATQDSVANIVGGISIGTSTVTYSTPIGKNIILIINTAKK